MTPGFLGPFWGRVAPFALTTGDQFRPSSGPARFASPEFVAQARQCSISALASPTPKRRWLSTGPTVPARRPRPGTGTSSPSSCPTATAKG